MANTAQKLCFGVEASPGTMCPKWAPIFSEKVGRSNFTAAPSVNDRMARNSIAITKNWMRIAQPAPIQVTMKSAAAVP